MTLPEIIFRRIPPAILERVVYDQGHMDQAQFTSLFKASGFSQQQIAERVVEAYGDKSAKLAFGLYQQIHGTDWETARDLYEHFNRSTEFRYDNHEASLVGRYPNLSIDGMSEFLRWVKRRVCLIVSRKGKNGRVVRGTGFLVGPDLVLTCRHVLPDFTPEDDIREDGSAIELYFDFFYGDPVDSLSPNLPDARKVALDRNWHIASCKTAVPDGLVGELSEEEIARISESLDFVLLRLEAPVGLQPLEKGGGRRRGWIQLPPGDVPLAPEAWIIIPQHPDGWSQRIDLGRFRELDQTGTRIRYLVNTAKGTSGAPCFNHGFLLVGLHNAYVGPPGQPVANQAIRFDRIASVVRTHVNAGLTGSSHSLRWSISRSHEDPQVILGREKVLTWLRDSATTSPRSLLDRVYAAQADAPGAGCSFTIDLLHAEIRGSTTPRAVYGARGQQLPPTAEDFLLSLLRELGIDVAQLEEKDTIPPRPKPSGHSDPMAGEIDKLERWLSDELPTWLGNVIVKHVEKKIDIRDRARQAREYFRESNQKPPEDVRKNADSAEPIYVRPNSWDFAYVVIDDLRGGNYSGNGPRSELKGEVRSLIAALVKGKPEQLIHPGLGRLRWMFLGYVPDFVSANPADTNAVMVEVLDPAAIRRDEVLSIFMRMADAYVPMQDLPPNILEGLVDGLVALAETRGTPERRLSGLQQTVNVMTKSILKHVG
jgi:hypothetical protein